VVRMFWQRKVKDDFYITLLKYVREKTVKGERVDYTEAEKHVVDIHGAINEGVLQRVFVESVEEPTGFTRGNTLNNRLLEEGCPLMMSLESYFQLLEHEEMEQARSSSKWALRVAIVAILITLGVSAASFIAAQT